MNAVHITGLFEPDAIVLHRTDYPTVVTEKDATGQYIHGPSNDSTTRRLWGRTVITSPVSPRGPDSSGLRGACMDHYGLKVEPAIIN